MNTLSLVVPVFWQWAGWRCFLPTARSWVSPGYLEQEVQTLRWDKGGIWIFSSDYFAFWSQIPFKKNWGLSTAKRRLLHMLFSFQRGGSSHYSQQYNEWSIHPGCRWQVKFLSITVEMSHWFHIYYQFFFDPVNVHSDQTLCSLQTVHFSGFSSFFPRRLCIISCLWKY